MIFRCAVSYVPVPGMPAKRLWKRGGKGWMVGAGLACWDQERHDVVVLETGYLVA